MSGLAYFRIYIFIFPEASILNDPYTSKKTENGQRIHKAFNETAFASDSFILDIIHFVLYHHINRNYKNINSHHVARGSLYVCTMYNGSKRDEKKLIQGEMA